MYNGDIWLLMYGDVTAEPHHTASAKGGSGQHWGSFQPDFWVWPDEVPPCSISFIGSCLRDVESIKLPNQRATIVINSLSFMMCGDEKFMGVRARSRLVLWSVSVHSIIQKVSQYV